MKPAAPCRRRSCAVMRRVPNCELRQPDDSWRGVGGEDFLPPLHVRLTHALLWPTGTHRHAVRVCVVWSVTCDLLHRHAGDALRLRHWAVLVREK